MKTKLLRLASILVLALGVGVIAAPAEAVTQGVTAQAALQPVVTTYEHYNFVNVRGNHYLSSGTCDADGYHWGVSSVIGGEGRVMSSMRYYPAPDSLGQCNAWGLTSWAGPTWTECISRHDNENPGFGYPWNDNVKTIHIWKAATCPPY
jgi:hypothetical protein